MASSKVDLPKEESLRNPIPSDKEGGDNASKWHAELAEVQASNKYKSENGKTVTESELSRTADGKGTSYKDGDFHVTENQGIYIIEEKIGGQLKGTHRYDTNTNKGEVTDGNGKRVLGINGQKQFLEHPLDDKCTLYQGSDKHLHSKNVEELNGLLEAAPVKPLQERIIVVPNGGMRYQKGGDLNNDAIDVKIDKTSASDKSSQSILIDVNGRKIDFNKFTDWNANGSYDFLDKNGKSVVKMYKDGRLETSSTTMNAITSELRIKSGGKTITTKAVNDDVTVDRPNVAKFVVNVNGEMKNVTLGALNVFRSYDPKLKGVTGLFNDGTYYAVNHDHMFIRDSQERRVVIHSGGGAESYNSQGRLLYALGPGQDVIPGFHFDNNDEDENGGEDKDGSHANDNSTKELAAQNAIDVMALAQGAVTLGSIESGRGMLAEFCMVLSNAAQKATSDGNLAMASLCSRSLGIALAASDLLARKSDLAKTA